MYIIDNWKGEVLATEKMKDTYGSMLLKILMAKKLWEFFMSKTCKKKN